MINKYNIAVVGATGMVGSKMIQMLEEYKVPVNNFYAFASSKSAGKKISFSGREYYIIELNEENIQRFSDIDFAIFSAGGTVSKIFAPIFARNGTIVIDNSSQWRMDKSVPLVVPEVNSDALEHHNNIIANPNCSTIQAVVALAPLHRAFGIKRIVYSTYQAVSGAGVQGYEDLRLGIEGVAPKKFAKPIFSNVLPHIDSFLENGYTKEEEKMINETRKILADESIKITATTVRVPVYNSHSESINVEFHSPITLQKVKDVLQSAKGVKLIELDSKMCYPTPLEVTGTDDVYVGRLRLDDSLESGINCFVVADNIRKGAATNAIQICQALIELDKQKKAEGM